MSLHDSCDGCITTSHCHHHGRCLSECLPDDLTPPSHSELASQLEALDKLATPGPWRLNEVLSCVGDEMIGEDVMAGDRHVICFGHDYDDYGNMDDADGRLIVALRNALPRILAVLRGQAAEKETT